MVFNIINKKNFKRYFVIIMFIPNLLIYVINVEIRKSYLIWFHSYDLKINLNFLSYNSSRLKIL